MLVVMMFLLYGILSPRSYVRMREKAFYEFNDYAWEANIKKDVFTGPELMTDDDDKYRDYLVFRWTALVDVDTVKLYAYVSSYFYQRTFITGTGKDELFKRIQKPYIPQRR